MATYTYNDPTTGFTYSYDETEPTDKDRIRGLIGDIAGTPIWYVSDASIEATVAANTVGGQVNFWEAAAQVAEKCSGRVLSLHEEVQQGSRYKIKNFEPNKVMQAFAAMAASFRANQQPINGPTNPGAVAGAMDTVPYDPSGTSCPDTHTQWS